MMTCCVCKEEVTVEDFVNAFPEFQGTSKIVFCGAFRRAHAYVDPMACPSGWSPVQHKLAVMLAVGHVLFNTPGGKRTIQQNGLNVEDYAGTGNITMATEGSVSIMKKVYSPQTATENDLLNSIYGTELLSLYEAINPPKTCVSPAPYYPVGYKWY